MNTHTFADAVLRAVPFRRRIVSLAAILPPALRGRASYRMSAALARRTELPPTLETNMGIYAGLRCRIPPASHVVVFGKPDLYHGERGPLALAAQLCRHADAFVDIGAHLGYFSIFVRAHCGPELPIYFFEADERLFQAVQDNVARNRLPHITGFQQAIGAASGTAQFYHNHSDPLSGSLTTMFAQSHDVEAVPVRVTSYADFARAYGLRRACAKVDIEGAEQLFVDGAADAFDTVDSLIIEVLRPAVEQGFVRRLTQQSGFHAYYINDYVLEHSPLGDFRDVPAQYNWLFCRRDPHELAALLAGSRLTVA